MFWFSPCIFCLRWLSWTDVQVRFSSLLLALKYKDCANQTSCTDMPLHAYYPVLLPVTKLSTVWSSKVATLALTNSLGCGFGNSTRSWGLLSHCDCESWIQSFPSSPHGFIKRHQLGTCPHLSINHRTGMRKKWAHVCHCWFLFELCIVIHMLEKGASALSFNRYVPVTWQITMLTHIWWFIQCIYVYRYVYTVIRGFVFLFQSLLHAPFLENVSMSSKWQFISWSILCNNFMEDILLRRSWIVTLQHSCFEALVSPFCFLRERHAHICLLLHYQENAGVWMASSNRKDLLSCSWIAEPPSHIMLNTIMQTFFFIENNTK